MTKKTQYKELSDLEKLAKQWWKLSGLHNRAEWSAAIVRAATAAEISANIAIRKEFLQKSNLSKDFIDSLLIWANGLRGKLEKILSPLVSDNKDRSKEVKRLSKIAMKVNDKRNKIAHSGEFCNEEEAVEAIKNAKDFIEGILAIYEPNFQLKEQKQHPKDS